MINIEYEPKHRNQKIRLSPRVPSYQRAFPPCVFGFITLGHFFIRTGVIAVNRVKNYMYATTIIKDCMNFLNLAHERI